MSKECNLHIVCKQIQFDMPNMACFLSLKASALAPRAPLEKKNTQLKQWPSWPSWPDKFCVTSSFLNELNWLFIGLWRPSSSFLVHCGGHALRDIENIFLTIIIIIIIIIFEDFWRFPSDTAFSS